MWRQTGEALIGFTEVAALPADLYGTPGPAHFTVLPWPTPGSTHHAQATTTSAGLPVARPWGSSRSAAKAVAAGYGLSGRAGWDLDEERQLRPPVRRGSRWAGGIARPALLRRCTCTRTRPRAPPASAPPSALRRSGSTGCTPLLAPWPVLRSAQRTWSARSLAVARSRCVDRSSPPGSDLDSGSSASQAHCGCPRHRRSRRPNRTGGLRGAGCCAYRWFRRPVHTPGGNSASSPQHPTRPRQPPHSRAQPPTPRTRRRWSPVAEDFPGLHAGEGVLDAGPDLLVRAVVFLLPGG